MGTAMIIAFRVLKRAPRMCTPVQKKMTYASHPATWIDTLRASPRFAAWDLISADAGTLRCPPDRPPGDPPRLWMILGGHVRTLAEHRSNLEEMMRQSSDCSHATVFSRHLIAEHSIGHGAKIKSGAYSHVNVTRVLLGLSLPNVAFVVTRRRGKGIWAHLDTWFGGYEAHSAVLRHHGASALPHDLLLFARPDVVYSHAIRAHAFADRATNYVIYLSHHSGPRPGNGNDPSEVFMLTSADHWRMQYDWCGPHFRDGHLSFCPRAGELRCGRRAPELMVELPSRLNVTVWYGRSELSVGLHRMQNRGTVGIGGAYRPSPHLTPVDATSALRRTHPDCGGAPPARTSRRRGLMPQLVSLDTQDLPMRS